MATVERKPFQGVTNIIRFNWHFYVAALAAILLVLPFTFSTPIIILIATGSMLSLLVSYYIYDFSGLYNLNWLPEISKETIVNIHAGFDETSALLAIKYPDAQLMVFDFYDPVKHTEVSVKRARKVYPPYPGTNIITTDRIPLAENSVDLILLIFSAHEIRNHAERMAFFLQLNNALKPAGSIIVTEHQRDLLNFLAYNFGFFHFFSSAIWRSTFTKAGLCINHQTKNTPFISTYTLKKC